MSKQLINITWQKLSGEFERSSERQMGSPFYFDDKVIYHYTNASGLKGIIEDNCLWATNLSYVNDSKELGIGLSIYQNQCKKLFKKEKGKERRVILKSFLECLTRKNISNRYACCFTSNGDQLSQWRGYGFQGLGYSIGFETKKLVGHLIPEAEPSRIIYEEKTQEKFAKKHIEHFVDGFIDLIKKKNLSLDKYLPEIVNVLEQEAEFTIIGFKHPGFKEESENRLHLSKQGLKSISILDKNGMLIPYVKLKVKRNKKLPITTITIGPTADFDRACKGVRFLLDKHGYKKVEIRKSEIPFQVF